MTCGSLCPLHYYSLSFVNSLKGQSGLCDVITAYLQVYLRPTKRAMGKSHRSFTTKILADKLLIKTMVIIFYPILAFIIILSHYLSTFISSWQRIYEQYPVILPVFTGKQNNGILVSCLSLFFCRFVATPLASILGVKETTRLRAPHVPVLEAHYCKDNRNPTQVAALCPHHVCFVEMKSLKSDLFALRHP